MSTVQKARTNGQGHLPAHEVIWGPPGSGKTHLTRQLLAQDRAVGSVQSWIVDLNRSLPEWAGTADRYARSNAEVFALMGDAVTAELPAGKLRCITIEDASDLLRDGRIRRDVERVAEKGQLRGVILRVNVLGLRVADFGGSKALNTMLFNNGLAIDAQALREASRG